MGQQLGMPIRQFAIPVQHRRHFVVGQAGMGTHHRRIEAGTGDGAGFVDIHVAGHAEPIHLGIDGAETIRQDLGQHRYHPIGKIDGVTALAPFLVQCAAWRDVMGHIGDRDQQTASLWA